MRSACKWFGFFKAVAGKRYCVLHYPRKGKAAEFERAVQRKLAWKDFDFRGVWFPDKASFGAVRFTGDADFRNAEFQATAFLDAAVFSGNANFSNAIFNANANFSAAKFAAEADFTSVRFVEKVDFDKAIFNSEANFKSAIFKATTVFSEATFAANADFDNAIFDGYVDYSAAVFLANAGFRQASFSGNTNFDRCTLGGYVEFSGAKKQEADEKRPGFNDKAALSFQFAKIESPAHLSFHTLTMRPSWFVDVDASKFYFTDVDWGERRSINLHVMKKRFAWYRWRTIGEELSHLPVDKQHSMLEIACSRLADNAEENRRFEEASRFRHMAMDTRRRSEKWKGHPFWKLSWWYWLASGYGERAFQALGILLGVWVLFAALYTLPMMKWEPKPATSTMVHPAEVKGFEKLKTELTYSAGVITLQRPEPRPASRSAQAAVLAETILGPLQAAMLALAIRRKFMR